jgi:hypothetical protein
MNRVLLLAIANILLSLFSSCFPMEKLPAFQELETFEANLSLSIAKLQNGLNFRIYVSNIHEITNKVLEVDKNKIGFYKLSKSDKQDLKKLLNDCTNYLLVNNINESYADLQLKSYVFLMICKKNHKLWESLRDQERITSHLYETYLSHILNLISFTDAILDKNDDETMVHCAPDCGPLDYDKRANLDNAKL